jgi:hypothetical protein
MTKKIVRKKRVTWTFQPADDVQTAVKELLGDLPERGELTKLINAAVRLNGGEALKRTIDEQIATLEAKKKSLTKKP